MSKLRDRRGRHDAFYQKAKKEGYAARSVFKLEEIDAKHHLFAPGQRVLDLGSRPGSWLQYASAKVGPGGTLVGIDRQPLDITIRNTRVLVGDVFTVEVADLLGELPAFDVVMSDMAPDTSGIRNLDQTRSESLVERALDIAEATLAPGGHFLAKLFMGPGFEAIRKRCRERFAKVAMIKPKGTRTESIEQYLVALTYAHAEPR